MLKFFQLILILLFSATQVHAAGGNFLVSTSGGDVLCGENKTTWSAGLLKQKGTAAKFVFYISEVRKLKRQLSKSANTKEQKVLRKRIKSYQKLNGKQDPYCKLGPPLNAKPIPSLYPTLPPFVTPSVTPTPVSGSFFDKGGNLTNAGKTYLKVPLSLPANIEQGKQLYSAKCTGCHEERTNRDFATLREKSSQEPMFYTVSSLPDTELANITAYLNRFY